MRTIAAPSTGLYREKGSKFLAFALPVSDVEMVKAHIDRFRKEYHDARHVCYAYMLGEERTDFRANDDGEPTGTAGRPILGQINSAELTDVLVVVVRYFGGILLGTGGLIVAYKEAAADALRCAEIIEKSLEIPLTIRFLYTRTNDVSRLISELNLTVTTRQFDTACTLTFAVPKVDYPTIQNRFKGIYGVEIQEPTFPPDNHTDAFVG